MYYLYKDHLGSITAIANQSGTIEYHSFDAWERLRNPSNWTFNNIPAMTILDRGYTGHEHLADYGLINMNGRMYDPLLGQMLSPDPYVQDIAGTQGYNRYSYCMNNPLKYTDPSGEFIQYIIGAIMGGINGAQIGKAKGATGGEMFAYIFGGAMIGGATAGLSTALSAPMGTVLSTTLSNAVGRSAFSYLATFQANDVVNGLWKGAATGLVGGLVGAPIGGDWGALAGGAASGALGSALNNPKNGWDILWGGISGGTMSYAMYHANAYVNWKWRGGTTLPGDQKVKYSSYNKINADWSRSRFTSTERGGWLFEDGSYERFKKGEYSSYEINPKNIPSGATGMIHMHWMHPNHKYLSNEFGVRTYAMIGQKQFCTDQIPYRYHTPEDIEFGQNHNISTYTINQSDASHQINGASTYTSWKDHLIRYLSLYSIIP